MHSIKLVCISLILTVCGWGQISNGGGGGSPAIPLQSLQYNLSGLFAGSGLQWEGTEVHTDTYYENAGGPLNDMTPGGSYTGVSSPGDYFKVDISIAGTPDSFTWVRCTYAGVCSTASIDIAITGAAQLLANGVTVTFASTTGHTVGDNWIFYTGAFITPPIWYVPPVPQNSLGTYNPLTGFILEPSDNGRNFVTFRGNISSQWTQQASGSSPSAYINVYSTRGTFDVPTNLQDGDTLGAYQYQGLANGNKSDYISLIGTLVDATTGDSSWTVSVTGIPYVFGTSSFTVPVKLILDANCSSATSPAACSTSSTGSIAIPTGITSVALTVNTTAITGNSQIFLFADDTLGTKLGVTCNSTLATLVGGMAITNRVAGTSFEVTHNGTIAVNPLCLSYLIVN